MQRTINAVFREEEHIGNRGMARRDAREWEKKGERNGPKEKYMGKEKWKKEKEKGKNVDIAGGRGEKKREQVLNLFYLVV
jgi:hypothetical protein